MKKVVQYREHTGIAIDAMKEAAEKDEYADQNKPIIFPKAPTPQKATNLKEWRNMRKKYKDSMEAAINAMMASASKEYSGKR